MINWESDSLSYQLSANWRTRRLCFPDEVSAFSLPPPQTHFFISALSTDSRTLVFHQCLWNDRPLGSFSQRGQNLSQCYWFERLKWPTQRYFSKASTVCMDYCYNQENTNIHYFKNPTEGKSSSFSSGSACYLAFPYLRSCLHFTSNYFPITSFSIVLPPGA